MIVQILHKIRAQFCLVGCHQPSIFHGAILLAWYSEFLRSKGTFAMSSSTRRRI